MNSTADLISEPDLIACQICDMLHAAVTVPLGGRLRCTRCGAVLMTNRAGAFDRTLAGAFASLILMASAIFFPFLELSVVGLRHRASLLDAILAFSSGLALPLSLATALLIVIIPLIRAIALAYTILPLRMGRTPAPSAERAFRLAAHLRPWSMAEVFIIGAAVALVKVSGMASVSLGTGFWAMAFLVVVVIYEGTSLCERTVWQTLERQRAV